MNLTEINHKVSLFTKGCKPAHRCFRAEKHVDRRIPVPGNFTHEAFMQDAHVNGWLRESRLPAAMLDSLHDLNHRFLSLAAREPDERDGIHDEPGNPLRARLAPLTGAQRTAVAGCPYALFDLRFQDDAHWQMCLQRASRGRVAEDVPVAPETLEFVRLALFFAWHVASTGTLTARLILGMQEPTASALRAATIDVLPALAATEATHLTARWSQCVPYWRALTAAACRSNPVVLRRAQLYGLQLAAASRLELRRAPCEV